MNIAVLLHNRYGVSFALNRPHPAKFKQQRICTSFLKREKQFDTEDKNRQNYYKLPRINWTGILKENQDITIANGTRVFFQWDIKLHIFCLALYFCNFILVPLATTKSCALHEYSNQCNSRFQNSNNNKLSSNQLYVSYNSSLRQQQMIGGPVLQRALSQAIMILLCYSH